MLNKNAQTIKNRLSLREPQAISLEILTKLADTLPLANTANLAEEQEMVRALHPTTFSEFERDFPSVTFSLATGVGKTRLMGAFIAYLYIEKGIKNFFVIAPGNTIYNKLIDDLSNPNSPKYVFRGISEFAVTPPKIITGENYNDSLTGNIFGETIRINIFNIQKISSEMRGGKEPRIKRLSEYLGESYFDYLSGLDDLVVLMDESHHYRAAAGMKAINELKAVLGLELTATPIDSRGAKFKNVVYEYSLAHGLRDGFLKEPAVATRRDFNPDQYKNDPKELDLIKLEDALRIHENTKVELDIYARNTNNKRVKPFVLVVAQNIDHATELRELIESDKFFDGRYKGKVLQVDSGTTGNEEKDEVVTQLLSVEDPENKIEIVVHVNMLKEGWDVTNLYTIVPLRSSASKVLTEQTMGRGLRLPYGKRTGVAKVDTLTIIAHDRFQDIVDAANAEGSIIKRENIIEIHPASLPEAQSVVTATGLMDDALAQQRKTIESITNEVEKRDAVRVVEAKQAVLQAVGSLGDRIKNIDDLKTDEIKKVVFEQLKTDIQSRPQGDLFTDDLLKEAEHQYQTVIQDVIEKVIPIPRILIQQVGEVRSGFHHFELDTSSLNYQPVSEEIVRRTLRTNENEDIGFTGIGVTRDTPVNIIVNELINYPEVDYDQASDLLYALANSAITKLHEGKTEEDVKNIVLYHKKQIASFIYAQLQKHFYIEAGEFEEPIIYPFTKIEPHNFSMYTKDKVHHHTESIQPTSAIPSKVFGGFTKACHTLYKFDSKAEKDFATILESDKDTVKKWLRPARAQFTIYWDHNSKRYEPDFIVEASDAIYMVEVKAERNTEDTDVQEKARAAVKYCESASQFNAKNRGKKWVYAILPHNQVALNRSFTNLMTEFQYKDK